MLGRFKISDFDFINDWREILRNQLSLLGYNVGPNESPQTLCRKFFNFKKRWIFPRPRNILEATGFIVPSEVQDGLELVRRKITTGDNLRPHLSKCIQDLDFKDLLLYDWGISHLHLGITLDDNGFVERTGLILFVRFTEDTAYFLKVLQHGRGHNPWTMQELIRTIHENWPETIADHRLRGITNTGQQYNDEEYSRLREIRVTVLVGMDDGTVYAPLGGGYATDGTSIDVVRSCDYYIQKIRALQANIDQIIVCAEAQGMEFGPDLDLHLNYRNDKFCIIERNSGNVISLRNFPS